MSSCYKIIYETPQEHSRKTDKQGIHANEYQDMAIRSLDNTKKSRKLEALGFQKKNQLAYNQ